MTKHYDSDTTNDWSTGQTIRGEQAVLEAFAACKKTVVTIPPKPKPGKLRTTSAIFSLLGSAARAGSWSWRWLPGWTMAG